MASASITLVDYALLLAAAVLTYRLAVRIFTRGVRLPHPPGPRGYPIVGTLPLKEPSWVTYRDWSSTYNSDIIRVNMFGNNIIVLNSLEASVDLLERRSTIYSDRPRTGMTMLRELCGMEWNFGLLPYGQKWRDGRKAFQRELRPMTIQKYHPLHVKKVHQLLRAIFTSPDNVLSHIRHMVGGEIMELGYGIEVQEENDPWIAMAEISEAAVAATLIPGAYMVDLLPFLKYIPEWFPGAGFQRQARIWRECLAATRNKPYDLVKRQMENDPSATPDSAAKSLMENDVKDAKDPEYMENVVRSAVASMFIAGSDTSTSILWSFILAMVLHPDIFRKAQSSVDAVCHERLPDFTDRDSLPYVDALVRESLRWNPVVALNLAHQCRQDDVYRGFYIAEGSLVLSNLWAILHDPSAYDAPEDFNPERFLKYIDSSHGRALALDPDVRDPLDVAFGFGRRVCPGRYLARDLLWLAIASVIAACDIDKATDKDGVPMTPAAEYGWGFTCHPKPFACKITPRSPEHTARFCDSTASASST